MAEKTGARKKRTRAPGTKNIWLRSDPRRERRFEPKTSTGVVASVLGMSIGAVLVGAGTYGQWLRAEDLGPHPWAPYLLGGGAILFLAVAIIGQRLARPIRVGDAGVAQENDANDIERIAWFDVVRVLASGGMITVQANGRSIMVSPSTQPAGAALLLSEARARIGDRVEGDLELPAPAPDDGESVALEPPQLAGQRCKASDRLIAHENDARSCARCGEVYHKDEVPKACITCGASFGAAAPAGDGGYAPKPPAQPAS